VDGPILFSRLEDALKSTGVTQRLSVGGDRRRVVQMRVAETADELGIAISRSQLFGAESG